MWTHSAEHWHHAVHQSLPLSHEGGWLVHTIVSALIHGLVYGAIFHLMRGMSTGEVLMVAVLGIVIVGGGWWLWNRR